MTIERTALKNIFLFSPAVARFSNFLRRSKARRTARFNTRRVRIKHATVVVNFYRCFVLFFHSCRDNLHATSALATTVVRVHPTLPAERAPVDGVTERCRRRAAWLAADAQVVFCSGQRPRHGPRPDWTTCCRFEFLVGTRCSLDVRPFLMPCHATSVSQRNILGRWRKRFASVTS